MKYSPVSKLYIKNFRNIGEAVIDFTQSPIVTLLGENEAGKTSVIKAFSVCALHSSPRDQKDYIRDGSDSFGVAIELEDGTRIVRQKFEKGQNSYNIIYPDRDNYYIDKLQEGLPTEVQKLMGLIEEPETKEYLHIRTYEDKLMFVVTPNSTNYKVMYNALKIDNLTRAIKLGSDQVNEVKKDMDVTTAQIEGLGLQMNSIKVFDIEQLVSIREQTKIQLARLDKIEKCVGLIDKVEKNEDKLGLLALIDNYNLTDISEVLISKLSSANRLLCKYSDLNKVSSILAEADVLETIDLGILEKCEQLSKKISEQSAKIETASTLDSVNKIGEISEGAVLHLNKLKQYNDKIKALQSKLDIYNTDSISEISDSSINGIGKMEKIIASMSKIAADSNALEQCNNYVIQVEEYLKQIGVAVEACPKCGEAVIFDIDKM